LWSEIPERHHNIFNSLTYIDCPPYCRIAEASALPRTAHDADHRGLERREGAQTFAVIASHESAMNLEIEAWIEDHMIPLPWTEQVLRSPSSTDCGPVLRL
jgi:hypothetical protein